MAVHRIKEFVIVCDNCNFRLKAVREERPGRYYLSRPLPYQWKRTSWSFPQRSRIGRFGGSFDQCLKCAVKEKVEIPDKAIDVRTRIGKVLDDDIEYKIG